MLGRQKILISLLQEAGGRASRIQLMKWSFLLGKETPSQGGNSYYKFVPYMYGPHSFSLYQEIDSLLRDGVFEINQEQIGWRLKEPSQKETLSLPRSLTMDLRYVMNRLRKIPFKFSYIFECQDNNKPHRSMIEDWEL